MGLRFIVPMLGSLKLFRYISRCKVSSIPNNYVNAVNAKKFLVAVWILAFALYNKCQPMKFGLCRTVAPGRRLEVTSADK